MPLYPLAAHAAQPAPHRQASYPSSMTDQEWAIIQPLLDPPARPHGGRPPKHSLRLIVDAIRYLVRSGGAWRLLPGDFPPWQTVYWWFAKWASDHTLDRVHDALRDQVRVAAGRTPAPSAAIIDSQSVRAADTVPRASRGFDAGRKVNGRKRHLAVDILGLLLVVLVTAACARPRRRPAAAVAAARRLPRHPPGMGRRRLRRQAGRLGRRRAAPGDRRRPQAPGPVDLRGAATQMGGGANVCVDRQAPPHRAGLRAPARPSRGHGQVGDDRGDDPTPGPQTPTRASIGPGRMTALKDSLRCDGSHRAPVTYHTNNGSIKLNVGEHVFARVGDRSEERR